MDGIGLWETVSRMQPKIPVIRITGFWGVEIEENAGIKDQGDFVINHSACIYFSALLKRWRRKTADIFNFTVMVKKGGQ
jgi:hypothetical protein